MNLTEYEPKHKANEQIKGKNWYKKKIGVVSTNVLLTNKKDKHSNGLIF